MSSPLLEAGASRPRSGILTPSSDGSLNGNDAPKSLDSIKRRSDSVAMDHLLNPPIALKSHPAKLHVQPRVLQPLMVLPRKHLPLACIDFHASHTDLPQSRFFEAHIKILDLESRMGSAPVVLLARNDTSRTVYALERQDDGLYVACRLGPWVEMGQLAKHATAICAERLRPTTSRDLNRHTTSGSLTTPQLHKDQKQKRAAIEAIQSLVRKRARSQSVSTLDRIPTHEDGQETTVTKGPLPSPVLKHEELKASAPTPKTKITPPALTQDAIPGEPRSTQTADDIFDTLRTQYFEALYKSMGSLAYFAKGPLSRARSAFHMDLDAALEMGDLIEFLKSLILTTVQVDKKYRETIPEVVSKMKTIIDSSDEGRKKRRRVKKMKLGKDGLYPYEVDHIRIWWQARKDEWKGEETQVPVQHIRSLSSMLRTRETQLQMILILETLALESLKVAENTEESQSPTLPGEAESQDQMAPPPKKRNKHNLPVLVDVHADRLTIWQSTASDEQLLLEDSQGCSNPADGQGQKASSEPLKDFCVDVIIPFFSARLPEVCDLINRKLGGPVIAPISKSRSLRRVPSKRDQKPGEATRRAGPIKAPRTLQRALSTDQQRRSVSRGPSNMIALMRSATSTSLPAVKREASEPAALRAMINGESNLLNKRSGSLSRSSSISNLQDPKATKRALVEAELKNAISALRKPNRETVGRAIAEEVIERRTFTELSAKKVRKPARASLGYSVTVKATPANNRFRDVFAPKQEAVGEDALLPDVDEVIPPSSIPLMVPSTGLRRGHTDAYADGTPTQPGTIGVTPTKRPANSSFLRRSTLDKDVLEQSPLMERKNSSAKQLFVPGSATKEQRRLSFGSPGIEQLFATPIKARPKESSLTQDSDEKPADENKSIYERLGWDDEFDDL